MVFEAKCYCLTLCLHKWTVFLWEDKNKSYGRSCDYVNIWPLKIIEYNVIFFLFPFWEKSQNFMNKVEMSVLSARQKKKSIRWGRCFFSSSFISIKIADVWKEKLYKLERAGCIPANWNSWKWTDARVSMVAPACSTESYVVQCRMASVYRTHPYARAHWDLCSGSACVSDAAPACPTHPQDQSTWSVVLLYLVIQHSLSVLHAGVIQRGFLTFFF